MRRRGCMTVPVAFVFLMALGARGADRAVDPRTKLELRMAQENLRNPYWYSDHQLDHEAQEFWDREKWEERLRGWEEEGYNAVLYWVEPWQEHAWQTFLIRHRDFPEARDLSAERAERVIEQVKWIFRRAHELGLKNFLFSYFVVTTRAFARAHGLDQDLPLSSAVDYRHTLKDQMGPHFGVRNELTRAFTEAAIGELFQTYTDLDGLIGGMGEALPGKRSTWYREAVVPGLKRSGRAPIYIVMNWMLPLEDFQADIARVYENTWVSVMANGEVITDTKPYPACVRWVEEAGVPAIIEIVRHNLGDGLPFNSPRMAHEIVKEYRKLENCKGYVAWGLRSNPNDLFRKALGYYGRNEGPYSSEPWIRLLEDRFGDRKAAEHLLAAFDASARITPEVGAIAWCPQDLGFSQQLLLPYWHWTGEDPRWSYLVSPARGGVLLPLRHYAMVVAQLGEQFRDNNGSDSTRNRDHPGSQELFWGLADYPTTPEAHMRRVRLLGEECLREAEQALKLVKKNSAEATLTYHYMMAYKLLSEHYERKVLAAAHALIHGLSGGRLQEDRSRAEKLADEAVKSYRTAIEFIWETIDGKEIKRKGRWAGKSYTLPELIEREEKERQDLGKLFRWPQNPGN